MILSKKIYLTIAILLFITGVFLFHFKNAIPTKKGKNYEIVSLTINKGDSLWQIGNKLEQSEVISNKYYLIFYLWNHKMTKKVIAGKYNFSPQLTIAEVAKIIISGPQSKSEEIKVTFPEGWTNQQMAKKLKEVGLDYNNFLKLSQSPSYFYNKYHYEFLKDIPAERTLEGFLFPDTYYFTKHNAGEEIIKKMLDNFNRKIYLTSKQDIARQNKSFYDVIIMASILEKEVKILDDKRKVSDIFWRRLRDNYPLQSCATLSYALGKNKSQYSIKDTQIDSPYNTYKNKGLPIGPINNPGKDSIKAAIYPEKNNFYFFLSNPQTGSTVFSHNLQEHNVNKIKNGL